MLSVPQLYSYKTSEMAVSELNIRPSEQSGAAAALSISLTVPLRSKSNKRSHAAAFMPSIGLEGHAMVEHQTALSDRQRVRGSFTASNFLSAHYYNDTKEKSAHPSKSWSMSVPHDVINRFRCIHPLSKKGSQSNWCFDGVATQGSAFQKAFNSFRSKPSSPEIQVRISSLWESTGEASIMDELEPPAYNSSAILIPISVSSQNPFPRADPTSAVSVICEATATWSASRTFTGDKNSPRISDTRAVKQSSLIVFPPICPTTDARRHSNSSLNTTLLPPDFYCSQGMVELSIPSLISIPSVESALLSVKYSLSLDLKFTLQDTSASDRRLTLVCKATIPFLLGNGV